MPDSFISTYSIYILLIISTYFVRKKLNSILKTIVVQTILSICYLLVIHLNSDTITGHDEYGLGKLVLYMGIVFIYLFNIIILTIFYIRK